MWLVVSSRAIHWDVTLLWRSTILSDKTSEVRPYIEGVCANSFEYGLRTTFANKETAVVHLVLLVHKMQV